jgi:hypothetical protein
MKLFSKQNIIEFTSVILFAVGMTAIFNLVEDCDLQSLLSMVQTAIFCMWWVKINKK